MVDQIIMSQKQLLLLGRIMGKMVAQIFGYSTVDAQDLAQSTAGQNNDLL